MIDLVRKRKPALPSRRGLSAGRTSYGDHSRHFPSKYNPRKVSKVLRTSIDTFHLPSGLPIYHVLKYFTLRVKSLLLSLPRTD